MSAKQAKLPGEGKVPKIEVDNLLQNQLLTDKELKQIWETYDDYYKFKYKYLKELKEETI